MHATEFLAAIFADAITPDRRLAIFTTPSLHTEMFADVESAVKYAEAQDHHQSSKSPQNIYFGLSLVDAGVVKGRGKLKNMAAIGALWADIDILDSAHKKKNLPPDQRAAMEIVQRVGLEPSIIVHSGHGLQVYWLLKETWIFDDASERHQAATLARRWCNTIRAVGRAHEHDLDAVGDLTRVFRLPGTINRKSDWPVPVDIVEVQLDLHYEQSDFDQLLVAEEFEPLGVGLPAERKADAPVMVDGITLRSNAEPPAMKLMAMLENDGRFKKTWNRSRKDLQDQSPSAYDLAIAAATTAAGWTDQETADVIIASRAKHGDDVHKGLRRDYMQRTIAKAKAGVQQEQAVSQLALAVAVDPVPPSEDSIPSEADTADTTQKVLKQLSVILGVPITKWVQHGTENARYSLQLDSDQWVKMGMAIDVLNARNFRARIYEATGILIKAMKAKAWDDVCKCLARAIEKVENPEASSAYQVKQWIDSYLADHVIAKGPDWQAAAEGKEPFQREGGDIYIHAGELRRHMRLLQDEKGISHVELCECLRVSGYKRVTVNFRRNDAKPTSRSYWVGAPIYARDKK